MIVGESFLKVRMGPRNPQRDPKKFLKKKLFFTPTPSGLRVSSKEECDGPPTPELARRYPGHALRRTETRKFTIEEINEF